MGTPSQPAPALGPPPKPTAGARPVALRPVPMPSRAAATPTVARAVAKSGAHLSAVTPPRGRNVATDPEGKPTGGLEPTVLFVGSGERFAPALEASLLRHRVLVESTTLDAVVDAVVTVAPDLVLVVGDAARDAGNEVLAKLTVLPKNFVVPIVILSDDAGLDAKLRAFRAGATAIIPRTASVDATAGKVAELAREIPSQTGKDVGVLGEATLEEFVATLEKELRTNLEAAGDVGSTADMRLVLGEGRPLAEFVDNFVRRVRRHVLKAEPLRYELGEKTGPNDDSLGLKGATAASTTSEVSKLRIVLADDDTPRADALSQALRARGATVVVTDLDPTDGRFQKLRQVDPTILMIGEEHAHAGGHSLLRRMRRDSRLRWASLLIVRWEDVWPEGGGAPVIERFESTLAGLAEPEHALRDRVALKAAFETRLEVIGPARCLRTLAGTGHALRLTLENARVEVSVDLSDGLVVGAQGRVLGGSGATLMGVNALSALLVVGSGRLRIEPADQPTSADVMAPVDVAITMADAESPPITPSMPAAGTVSINPPFQAPDAELRLPPLRAARIVPVVADPPAASTHAAFVGGTQRGFPAQPAPAFPATEPATVPRQTPAEPAIPAFDFQRPAVGDRLRRVAQRAIHWLGVQERGLHARRVSPRAFFVLLALAVVQGLLIVALYAGGRALFGREPKDTRAAATAPVALPGTPATPSVAPAPASAAQVPVAKPASEPTVAPPVAGRTPDGSGKTAPDCKTLFASDPPPEGFYPGAAWQEVRAGRTAIVRGDLKAAQTAFCRAVHWDKTNAEIALHLAQVLMLQRDGAEALVWADRARTLDPHSLRIQETYGDALARVGAHTEARSAWLTAARIDPSDQRGVRGLVMREMRQATTALRGRKLIVAEKFYRRAALLEPKSWGAMIGLSQVLLELGDVKAALLWGERAATAVPRNASVRLVLGDAYARAGDQASATASWREATLLDPANREARRRLNRAP